MLEPETTTSSLAEAVKFLKIYSCNNESQNPSIEERQKLQKAILMAVKESEWENIGICTDNLTEGLQTLESYLQALGYPANISRNSSEDIREPVYIKFNTQKMSYYADSYNGSSRGVLIATQGDEEAILGTYGYFPLDLFATT